MASLISIIMTPIVLIWQGFVLTKLWEWFIYLSFDIPELEIPIAIGVILIFQLLTGKMRNNDEDPLELVISSSVFGLVLPTFILLIGFITSLFI